MLFVAVQLVVQALNLGLPAMTTLKAFCSSFHCICCSFAMDVCPEDQLDGNDSMQLHVSSLRIYYSGYDYIPIF